MELTSGSQWDSIAACQLFENKNSIYTKWPRVKGDTLCADTVLGKLMTRVTGKYMKFFKLNGCLQAFALGTLGLGLTGCFEQGYNIQKNVVSSIAAPASTPTAGTTTQTAIAFRTLQPALAVRSTSCLMCHAQVASNIITDFGAGDSYFFGKGNPQGMYGEWYENTSVTSGYSAWSTAVIRGSVIVPKVNLDHSFPIVDALDPQHKSTSISLASVMQSTRAAADGTKLVPMNAGISPQSGNAGIIEKSKIYIGAPTDADLSALAPNLASVGFTAVTVDGISPNQALPLSGLQVVQGSSTNYVTNSAAAPFVCAGDVVVNGTLFLVSPQIKTDNNGCRLYVKGSVFIQGAISYVGSNLTTANLQVTSSRSINMGFNASTMSERLSLSGERTYVLPEYKTRSPINPATRHAAILAEATNLIGMVDAGSTGSVSTLNPMNGLLLNAPQVNSRYTGDFKGAVVAEIALFRLDQFVFSFDTTFQKVPILPALKNDILSLTD
jgi:hypothetical protein